MSKYRRRRRAARPFGQAHRSDCLCAGDHCGQHDSRTPRIRFVDDARTAAIARSVGLVVRSRRSR